MTIQPSLTMTVRLSLLMAGPVLIRAELNNVYRIRFKKSGSYKLYEFHTYKLPP